MGARFKELSDAHTAAETARAALPKTPGDYKVEFSEEFKKTVPTDFEVDLKNPIWKPYAELAHKYGFTQEQFNEGASLYAQAQIGERAAMQSAIDTHKAAEESKLGENHLSRTSAIHQWIDANADSPEDAEIIKNASINNAAIVKFLEKNISALQSGGITKFNTVGRDDGRRLDGKPANWDSMSDIDKRTWDLSNPSK